MISLASSAISVEYNGAFSVNFTGAQGEVTAKVATLDIADIADLSVSQAEGESTGTITGTLTVVAAAGTTATIHVKDTYDNEGVETTDTVDLVITVITDGIVSDLDSITDSDNVFGRQQALCDNQVTIAKKVNTVRNLLIVNVIGTLTSIIGALENLDDIQDALGDYDKRNTLKQNIDILKDDLNSLVGPTGDVAKAGKNTVDYGK